MSDIRNLYQFIRREMIDGIIPKLSVADTKEIVSELESISAAESHHMIQEISNSNYKKSASYQSNCDASQARDKRAKELVKQLGFKGLYINGDPRGPAYGIISESGRYNGLGGKDAGWRF